MHRLHVWSLPVNIQGCFLLTFFLLPYFLQYMIILYSILLTTVNMIVITISHDFLNIVNNLRSFIYGSCAIYVLNLVMMVDRL